MSSGVDAMWLASLSDLKARARIAARLDRLSLGNFGDCKALHDGVSELRIDWGPGYRVYYAMLGRTCVLLLCGGDKRRQSSDIKARSGIWKTSRKGHEANERQGQHLA
jgi:putative addiction module killer protein